MTQVDVDVLVVGSGAGGLTAAITAHDLGANVLVIEKTDQVGGTSAMSGGGIWVPCNHLMSAQGASDRESEALAYLKSCIGNDAEEDRLRAYVREAPRMVKYLDDSTDIKFVATPYADYFPELAGGKTGYRTLDPLPFDAGALGDAFFHLRPPHHQISLGGVTLTMAEARKVITRESGWGLLMAQLFASYWMDVGFRRKTARSRRLALGNALMARCYKSVLTRGIPVWREAALHELLRTGTHVTGARVALRQDTIDVRASRGVILATGGFEKNQNMRDRYLPAPTNVNWSAGNDGNEGDAITCAEEVGATTSLIDAAWWGPAIHVPGEDRARVLFSERASPGVFIINAKGERFLNEAASYDVVGQQLLAAGGPAWVVFDRTVRRKYMVGPLKPSTIQPDWSWSKGVKEVMFKARTLDELAAMIGADRKGLIATAEKVGRFAEIGIDEDFDRGLSDYDRYYGDPGVSPNPCLGPLARPPLYAFEVYPGDIGTKGGIKTDAYARALDSQDLPIEGLYATGNTSASVMGRTYPGAGSTIGPAMTFGYVAARHAMGAND